MVKLVRLTTDAETCVFKSNLDAGILVSKDAKIALQNVTFENEFASITIDDSNNLIKSNQDSSIYTTQEFRIPNAIYTKSTYTKFFDNLQASLNSTLSISNVISTNTDGGAAYRSYHIDYPRKNAFSGDAVVLEMRYTPMITPFTENNGDDREDETVLFQISDNTSLQVEDADQNNAVNRDNLKRRDADAASSTRNAFIFGKSPEIMLSRGAGVMCCRVENLGNTGDSEENGFGIGLSYTQVKNVNLDSGGNSVGYISDEMRDYEIRVKKSSDNYFTITPSSPNTEVDSGTAPFKYADTTALQNDLLIIEKNNNQITLRVSNSAIPGGQNAFTPVTYTIPDADLERPLYPYIYVCGAATDTEVGYPFMALDPTIDGNEEYDILGQSQTISDGRSAFFDLYLGHYAAITPSQEDSYFDGPLDYNTTPIISLNSQIWNYLGFNVANTYEQYEFTPLPLPIENYLYSNTGLNERMLRIKLVAQKDFSIVLSDNFVVLLDNYSLFSYDASRTNYGMNSRNPVNIANRGRRLNILATIPVNNNFDGYVEYETNSLVYIDLDLSSAEEIKNLNLRVLNKDLSPININGKAVMTLLIQD